MIPESDRDPVVSPQAKQEATQIENDASRGCAKALQADAVMLDRQNSNIVLQVQQQIATDQSANPALPQVSIFDSRIGYDPLAGSGISHETYIHAYYPNGQETFGYAGRKTDGTVVQNSGTFNLSQFGQIAPAGSGTSSNGPVSGSSPESVGPPVSGSVSAGNSLNPADGSDWRAPHGAI